MWSTIHNDICGLYDGITLSVYPIAVSVFRKNKASSRYNIQVIVNGYISCSVPKTLLNTKPLDLAYSIHLLMHLTSSLPSTHSVMPLHLVAK